MVGGRNVLICGVVRALVAIVHNYLTPWMLTVAQLLKKFPAFYGSNVSYHVNKSPPLVPILSQMNPVTEFVHNVWKLLRAIYRFGHCKHFHIDSVKVHFHVVASELWMNLVSWIVLIKWMKVAIKPSFMCGTTGRRHSCVSVEVTFSAVVVVTRDWVTIWGVASVCFPHNSVLGLTFYVLGIWLVRSR
jgi:hypothetical protein